MAWVWTEIAEKKKSERKAGEPVPVSFMTKGADGKYFPMQAWVEKGYVRNEV